MAVDRGPAAAQSLADRPAESHHAILVMAELDVVAVHNLLGGLIKTEGLVEASDGHLDQKLQEIGLLPERAVAVIEHQDLCDLQRPELVMALELFT